MYLLTDSLRSLKESTVCWKTLTTGMPRTYSTVLPSTSASAPCQSAMLSRMASLPVMESDTRSPATAGTSAARPSLQSNANSSPTTATGRTYVPARSGRPCAMNPWVESTDSLTVLATAPLSVVPMAPGGRERMCPVRTSLRFLAMRNAARWESISDSMCRATEATAVISAAHAYMTTSSDGASGYAETTSPTMSQMK